MGSETACRTNVRNSSSNRVTLPAVLAAFEVELSLADLGVGQDAVEVRLHHLLALVAGIEGETRHHDSSAAEVASAPLSIRRPRCNRDMTVPIGMSRICAASL